VRKRRLKENQTLAGPGSEELPGFSVQ